MSRNEVQVDVEGRTLTISNLDKVLYPRTGTTKGEVLNYYAQVSPVLLPHLKDRAVTRIRWPHGVEKASFFEKNAPAGTPSWVRTATVPTTGSRTGKGDGTLALPDLRRPRHAHLAGQPRRPRAARPPVDGRRDGHAPQPRPPGHRPRPRRAGRAARVRAGGADGPRRAGRARPALHAGDERQQGPPPVRPDARRRSLDSDGTTALAKEVAEELQQEHPTWSPA